MRAQILYDARDVEAALMRLNGKELKRAKRNTLAKASRILVSQTRKNAKQVFQASPAVLEGVQYKVARDANSAKIHIMGNKKKQAKKFNKTNSSRTNRNKRDYSKVDHTGRPYYMYIMNFFEKGTAERYSWVRKGQVGKFKRRELGITSKTVYRGRIKDTRFFASAQTQTESRIFSEINTNLEREIVKIWRKKE